MTSTLMILGAWFAVSAVLCLLLGAVVRRGEGLDAAAATPVRTAPAPAVGPVVGPVATAPVPVAVPVPTTRPVEVVTGGHRR